MLYNTSTVSISYSTYNYVNLGAVVENNHLQRVPKVVLTAQIRVANAARKTGFRLMPDDEGTWEPENRDARSSWRPLQCSSHIFSATPRRVAANFQKQTRVNVVWKNMLRKNKN